MDVHRPTGRRGLGFALALTTMLLWGVLPLALRAALRDVDPITLTAFRFVVSALALGAWLAARGRLPALRALPRHAHALLAIATLGLAANYLGFVLGLDRTSPATSQVLIQLGPLLLALGGIAVFGEHFSAAQWLGFGVLVAGQLTFFAGQIAVLGQEAGRYVSGVAWLVFAAATWAGYGLAQKQLLQALPSPAIMFCIYAGCALCFLPGAHPRALAGLDTAAWAVLLFCAANTIVAYGAFAAALEHWEASRVSAVVALTPLATIAFSELAARIAPVQLAMEPLSARGWIGAAAVVGGSLLAALARRSGSRDEPEIAREPGGPP